MAILTDRALKAGISIRLEMYRLYVVLLVGSMDLLEFLKRFSTTKTYAAGRFFWRTGVRRWTSEFRALSKYPLAAIVSVFTGHCPIDILPRFYGERRG